MGLRVRPRGRRRGGARRHRRPAAGRRRDPRLHGGGRGPDGPSLRALRRAAACAARPLGVRPVRARDPGRLPLRARGRRRQGQLLPDPQGGPPARPGGRAAGQRPHRLRRGGRDRRRLDRPFPRRRRARRGRLRHLRQRHAARGHARVRSRRAGPGLLPRAPPDRRARSALGRLRRRRAERRPRAHADARGRRGGARRAAGGRHPAHAGGDRLVGRARARRHRARRCRREAHGRRVRRAPSTTARWPARPWT